MSASIQKETLGFETEVKQLLHLVVHSLYSNKEIFLRELISNGSDALDKLRFTALSNSDLYENDPDLKIRIEYSEAAGTITITDNGIGMSREEVVANLGTIAKSGTREFLSQLSGDQAKDSNLIGQFGVGFYAAFIVADKVIVKTRRAGLPMSEGVQWESKGEGDYTINAIEKASRGTQITLHLKKEEQEFLNDWRLRSICTKYSDHISWPIEMQKPAEPAEDLEVAGEEAEGKKAEKAVEKAPEFESINRATALWTLQKNEITTEEYQELYKHVSHDFNEPMSWAHNHVEGKQQYISLLYIPTTAPFDMWQQESKDGLKLYVKRVFIMDDAVQFLPRYLRFVKGIIDSSDLPLNISREILQDNKQVETIKSACVKRVIGMLDKMAKNDAEKYQKFWSEFGLVFKEGPIEDPSNRESIAKLLRFATTHTDKENQNVSLDDYLARMKEGQDKIFYITGSSFNAIKNSPHMEIFRKKGIEVLLLSDRIDEWLVTHLGEYEGKQLQSVTKGEVDLDGVSVDAEEKTAEQEKTETAAKEDFDNMLKQVKEILAESIKEVRLTHRLTTSPACIVSDDNDMGREMQRILKAAGQEVPESKPILELNPEHMLIQRLNSETDDERFNEWSHILLDQAILAEGEQLENPGQFVQRLNAMLLQLAK